MASDRVRFLHATQLDLDEPLVGAGPLVGDDRRLAEDATLTAFSRVADACVDRSVDFLLLTGNAFDGSALTLRAKSGLEKGLEKLAEHDIPAFIMPGTSDAIASWSRIRLPDTVTLFGEDEDEPTDLVSKGRTLATIIPLVGARGEESNWDFATTALRGSGGLKVGLIAEGAPLRWDATGPLTVDRNSHSANALSIVQEAINEKIDYIGFGGGDQRRSIRLKSTLVHSPGSPQSRTRRGTGPHGCTFVEARSDGSLHHELVKTAPVRWETLTFEVRPGLAFEELVQKMSLQLLDRESGKESLWLVNWIIRGFGELFEQLGEPKSQRDLWDFVDEELRSDGVHRIHTLTREPPIEDSDLETTNLFLEYIGAIGDQLQPNSSTWINRGKTFETLGTPWGSNLAKVATRLDPDQIAQEARRMARLWWT
jgi:exonuclease SbcD